MSESKLALFVSLSAFGIYAYTAYHLNSPKVGEGLKAVLPPQLNVYGQFKFLTYQCFLLQIISTVLHILAHFIKPLRSLRDLVFTTLAFPVSNIVVLTFWAVYLFLSRELIFPTKLDAFYPPWLNHATHTIILPINIFLAILIHHKYNKAGFFVTLAYTASYVLFLFLIKSQTGFFVYGYLNELSETQKVLYFAGKGVFCFIVYKLGETITTLAHGSAGDKQTKQAAQKLKQKQK